MALASEAPELLRNGVHCFALQIMMAVAERGERPPVPDVYEAARLPGGSFLLHYQWVSLMQDCWVQEPKERPTFEVVSAFFQGRRGKRQGGSHSVAPNTLRIKLVRSLRACGAWPRNTCSCSLVAHQRQQRQQRQQDWPSRRGSS